MASLNLTVAYVLWLFGGLFGFHHVYLGRPYHAFVWFATLGGFCGLGWIRDVWRIPEYVQSSNLEGEFRFYKVLHTKLFPRPTCGFPRFVGMLVMGFLVNAMLCGLLPKCDEEDGCVTALLKSLYIGFTLAGSSLGVYIVANVGDMETSWIYPLLGSLLSFPWLRKNAHNSNMTIALSALVTLCFGLYWKPVEPFSKNRKSKAGAFFLAALIWTCLVYYVVVFSKFYIGSNNLNVAVGNVFVLPAWDRW